MAICGGAGRAAPVHVAHHQCFEKLCAERVTVHLVDLREFPHYGKLAKNFGKCFGVARACRGFPVVFRELERIRQEESIEAGRRAGPAVGGGETR